LTPQFLTARKEISMNKFKNAIRKFAKDETGAGAIEYGLLAALIALVVAAFLPGVSGAINGVFGRVITCLGGGAC